MWKRNETVRPPVRKQTAGHEDGSGSPPVSARQAAGESARSIEGGAATLGESVVIKGELSGNEDLTIEGQIEGTIELREHVLTIGPKGQIEGTIELREHVLTIGPKGTIKAQVSARSVIVAGTVTGDITATETVSIQENGSVDGDITAPRVAIGEGAHFRGSIDMQQPSTAVALGPSAQTGAKPAALAQTGPAIR